MTTSMTSVLEEFLRARPDQRDSRFDALATELWNGGDSALDVESATAELFSALRSAEDGARGYLLLLLGLFAESRDADRAAAVRSAIGAELDGLLESLARSDANGGERQALLFLLAHLPEERGRILSAVEYRDLAAEDRTRLERLLRGFGSAAADLGRVWPAPSAWTLTDAEREIDRAWIAQLSTDQLRATWTNDTDSLFGYWGAKALSAVRADTDATGARPDGPESAQSATRTAPLVCPRCGSGLVEAPGGFECVGGGHDYALVAGCLDLTTEETAESQAMTADVHQDAAVLENIAVSYETQIRPAFLRVMGGNWNRAVLPSDEDAYLEKHVVPADDGPVLDLAAGSGRWTEVLARTFGSNRVIALDINLSMLTMLGRRLPDVLALRASSSSLPFADGSLGAVNCWNALQALPDAEQAIGEVGRCLRRGGTFTIMTFRPADDQVYRYFQLRHRFPSRPQQLLLFEPHRVVAWLDAAGMRVRELSGSDTFVFITAVRV